MRRGRSCDSRSNDPANPKPLSCDRDLFRPASLKVLELDPDLIAIPQFEFERIQPTGSRAGGIFNFAGQRKGAVMAGTMIMIARKIDETPGVRTNYIEGLQLI